MLPKLKVLFFCTGNSCRSQMAEGWARHLRSGDIEPSSAGVRPTRLDPRAVAAMAESGVNIAQGHSKSLDRLQGVEFDRVVRDFRNLVTLELGYHRAIGRLATALARIQQATGSEQLPSEATESEK